jgi:5-oxoprolinase (ATP-hydrolysing) subunit A
MISIDLNSDMGEFDSPDFLALEAELMPLITSANIACGFHAGNQDLMRRTARLASQCGTAIGAHPGFRDTETFGRNDRRVSSEEIETLVAYQIGALAGVLALDRLTLSHVKPHGALYNMAAGDRTVAEAVVRAVAAIDHTLLVFALAGSELVQAAETAGLTVVREAFADRAYRSDGSLVPRSQTGALLQTEQEVRDRVHHLLMGFVTSIDGSKIPVQADSLCIHVDTPKAMHFARTIRNAIESTGVHISKVRNR